MEKLTNPTYFGHDRIKIYLWIIKYRSGIQCSWRPHGFQNFLSLSPEILNKKKKDLLGTNEGSYNLNLYTLSKANDKKCCYINMRVAIRIQNHKVTEMFNKINSVMLFYAYFYRN